MGRVLSISILVTCLVAGIFGKPLKPEERPMKQVNFNGEMVNVREEAKADPFSHNVPIDEYETPGAVETDMFFNNDQKEILRERMEDGGRNKRKAVRDLSLRWTKKTVPYIYDSSITDVERNAIIAGMAHWSELTCITFLPYTASLAASLGHDQKINFLKGNAADGNAGCWSWVGRQPISFKDPQPIGIGDGCTGLGTVAHEIGHALGFQHEQSRPDRDEHVEIVWSNIETSQQHNFEKLSIADVMSSDVIQYDYTSSMHYGAYGFATDPNIPTLLTKRAFDMKFIGQMQGLSYYDVKLANIIYECNSDCSTPLPECANGGYVDKTCNCNCPSDWTGALCTDPSTTPPVVTEITETAPSGEIKSTNYDSGNYPDNTNLMIYIVGQPDSTITLTFETFDLEAMFNNDCVDYVQVNTEDPRYGGDKLCGVGLPSTYTATHDMMVWFHSDETINAKGFKARYTIDKPLTTQSPTVAPTTMTPTVAPTTKAPTVAPTTMAPTVAPTTMAPTVAPTTMAPTVAPTTMAPTEAPTTMAPTEAPTTIAPTEAPTTMAPTEAPTTNAPTEAPTTKVTTEAPVVTTTQEIDVLTAAPMKTIMSPNYPSAYPRDYTSQYNIRTDVGKQIYLMVDDIEIQTSSSSGCTNDILSIDNGYATYRLCGNGGNVGPFVSTSNTMRLTLATDGGIEMKGFHATFTSFDSHSCGGRFGGDSGIVVSPNYPREYGNDMNCEYRIVVEEGKVVELTFEKFSVEPGPDYVCQYDCVTIEPVQGSASGKLGFDGKTLPGRILSTGNELLITISSDRYVPDKGFVAQYRAVSS